MEDSYKIGLELDRTDVNGSYEKLNCRWVSRRSQVINRRPTGCNFDAKFITYADKTLCISEWAETLGMPAKVLIDRLGKLKWPIEKAFTTKYKPIKKKLLIKLGIENVTK